MGLEYVDIFYHHRPDPNTPLEETMSALDLMVRQGKALYIGLSNYRVPEMQKACAILRELGTPCLIHQPRYSMLDRWVEDGLLDLLEKEGVGCIVFSPLAQGVLTGKYLNGIPADSRAGGKSIFLKPESLTAEKLDKVRRLNDLAVQRGQTLAQMALAWVLRGGRVTSALIGASKPEQIDDCVKAVEHLDFTQDELDRIEDILKE
jgi:L-glyceraldehyde 3-phosphate reductase